jgi:tRNA U38,U39,U40 pseudouridine synthase TruA
MIEATSNLTNHPLYSTLQDIAVPFNLLLNPLVNKTLDYWAMSSQTRKGMESTICTCTTARAHVIESGLAIELTADRFLRHQVRILVNTCVHLWLDPQGSLLDILQARERRLSAPPAPASGLVFVSAVYE